MQLGFYDKEVGVIGDCVWRGNQPRVLCKLSIFSELLSHLSSSIFGTRKMHNILEPA